jgi:hypothetical protein
MSPMVDIAAQKRNGGTWDGQVGMRNASGGMIKPLTTGETVRYGMGVRPYWYRQFRDEQNSLKLADTAFREASGQKVDAAADALLKGDAQPAHAWVREYLQRSPTADPRAAMHNVVDRGLVQSNAQDLLAQVATGNEDRAKGIARSYGDTSRQSEIGLLQQRAQLGGQLGLPAPDSNAVVRAGLVDELVRQGKTRSEALRLVELMGY